MFWRKKEPAASKYDSVKEIISLIKHSQKVIVFTGAGVSTASGIPDFRSPSSGLWSRFDPNIFTAEYFRASPDKFYEVGRQIVPMVFDAEPNITHKMVAHLEKMGLIAAVITQNIDGLHQKAGSKNVFELHGNLRQAFCLDCGAEYDMMAVHEKLNTDQNPPRCDKCQGILKINVILFGDAMPPDFLAALTYVQDADLFMILGSSMTVYPANLLPERVVKGKAKLIIINRDVTPYDEVAEIVIHDDLVTISQEIDTRLDAF